MQQTYTKIGKGQPRTRNIPGPAGKWTTSESKDSENLEMQQKQWRHNVKNENNAKIPLFDKILWQGAWLTAMNDCKNTLKFQNNILYMTCNDKFAFKNNLSIIKKNLNTLFKVTDVIVAIKQITVSKEAIGIMIDPFDEIQCLFHRECFTKHDIQPACVLLLTNITIMHSGPTQNDYYVCVTNSNITKIYPHNTHIPKTILSIFKPNNTNNNDVQHKNRTFIVKKYYDIYKDNTLKKHDKDEFDINLNFDANWDEIQINVDIDDNDEWIDELSKVPVGCSMPPTKKRKIIKDKN